MLAPPLLKARPSYDKVKTLLLRGLPQTQNLCTNGGFETNTTGWLATTTGAFWLSAGATLSRVTGAGNFLSGAAGLRIQVTAQQFRGGAFAFTAQAGQTYTFSFYVKGSATATLGLFIGEMDGGSSTTATFTVSATFQRYQATWTCLADTAAVVGMRTTTAADCDLVVDDVQIEIGTVATAYVETDGAVASARTCQRLWGFREVPGAATAVDECGNANGTYANVTLGAPGPLGPCASFNGTSSAVTMAASKEVSTIQSAVTIMGMVQMGAAAATKSLYFEDVNTAPDAFGRIDFQCNVTSTHATRINLRPNAAEAIQAFNGSKRLDGNWVHLALVIDMANDVQLLYINGVLTTVGALAFTATTFEALAGDTVASIGKNNNAGSQFLLGLLQYVAVFNGIVKGADIWRIAKASGA